MNRQDVIDSYNDGQDLEFIYFYGHHKKDRLTNACFSQFYDSPFVIYEVMYRTAEHWMMFNKAALFDSSDIGDRIMNAETPAEAKNLGRRVANFDPEVWDDIKYDMVVEGNRAKFSQNKQLKDYLLGTGNKILVEASPWDKIWGIGLATNEVGFDNPNKWEGENLLGFALMEVRNQLRGK